MELPHAHRSSTVGNGPLSTAAAAAASTTTTTRDITATCSSTETSNISSQNSTTTAAQDKLASLPVSQQATVLAHCIQRHCKTPAMAMEIIKQHVPNPSTATTKNGGCSCCLDWEEAYMAALQVCGKTKDDTTALSIAQECIPESDQCRSLAISICGRCHNIQAALSLVFLDDKNNQITTPAPYNAAIAACGTNRAWKDALKIVHHVMPRQYITTLTCNAVLTALVKSQQGTEALEFLHKGFDTLGIARDRLSYHRTVAALLSQGKLQEAVQLVLQDMHQQYQTTQSSDLAPNQETYDRLIAAVVSRRNALDKEQSNDAASAKNIQKQQGYYNSVLFQLQQASQNVMVTASDCNKNGKKKKRKQGPEFPLPTAIKRAKLADPLVSDQEKLELLKVWDFCKWVLPKKGKGKTAYWQLGSIIKGDDTDNGTIIVGLHPNRNPSRNGIQLWFLRDTQNGKRQKLGYLLMINTPNCPSEENGNNNNKSPKQDIESESQTTCTTETVGKSQFLGLYVNDKARQKGLAKVFVAIWLQCCLDANLQPYTGKMNKPLLCLVLQHSFHFAPMVQSGSVRARLLPPPNGEKDEEDDGIVRLTTEASAAKNLEGALTPRDIKEQRIQLVAPTQVPDGVRGRTIDVGGYLQSPSSQEVLQLDIQTVLQDRWKLSSRISTKGSTTSKEEERPLTMSRLFLGV